MLGHKIQSTSSKMKTTYNRKDAEMNEDIEGKGGGGGRGAFGEGSNPKCVFTFLLLFVDLLSITK